MRAIIISALSLSLLACAADESDPLEDIQYGAITAHDVVYFTTASDLGGDMIDIPVQDAIDELDSTSHGIDERVSVLEEVAGVCDCPAEAPLAGRLVERGGEWTTIAGGQADSVYAACDEGDVVIHGGCEYAGSAGMVVNAFGKTTTPGWRCHYRNTDLTSSQARATVLCLQPPPG